MRLQSKMITIVGVILIVTILVWVFVADTLFMNNYGQLERAEVQDALDATRYSLGRSISEINASARDYAAWDDTYSFVVNNNTNYTRDNLVGTTFENLRLNFILIENTDGKVVFANAYDLVNGSFVALPSDIHRLASTSSPLFFHNESAGTSTGILYTANGPLLIASQPILTSNGTGPIHGTLMFGRYLTPDVMNAIVGPDSAVSAYPFSAQSPADVQRVQPALAGGATSVIEPVNATNVAGFTLLRDIYGNPSLVIKEVLPRTVYQAAVSSTNTFLGLLVIAGVISLTCMVWALRQSVLAPLLRINTSLARIRTSDDLSKRVPERGDVELVWLARAINATLVSLESSHAERAEADNALRSSEQRFRAVAESAADAIVTADHRGVIAYWNAAAETMFGYAPTEVQGKLITAIFSDEFGTHVEAATLRSASVEQEYSVKRKDGTLVPIEPRLSVWETRDGEFVTAIIRDITERKLAEQKLRESERHIREITDTLPVVVFEADETSRVTFVNATAFDLFGYTKEELEAGMSILQLVTDADEERARTMFRRRMGDHDIGRMEYTGRRKDGSTFPISVRGAPIRRDGAVVGVRGIIVDITERKQAEERVREHTHTIEILNLIMTEGSRTTDVQSFAETVTDLTLELLQFDAGMIHLVDADARCANLRYATGIPDTAVEAIRKIPLDDEPYAGFLVEAKALFVDGHEASRVQHMAELGLESLAVVPLYRHDETIGALNVGSFKPHIFSQAEKELLIAIGNEAGTVITKLEADEALKESERRIRELTDALPVVVYETDATGGFTFVNTTAADLFGYTKEEAEAGMSIYDLIVPADTERAHAVFHRRMIGEDVGRVEYIGLRKDGSTFPISIRAVLIRRDGAVIGLRGVILDVTELKRAEDAIKASLKERETLLKEIHHRVKNNMQVVSSLLSLQAARAAEPETIETLNESQRQIRSMALIHEKLYRSGSLAEIDFGDYVESLINELLRMYNVPLGVITSTTDIESVQLGVDTAIPCALIINELVSNSLKYAFPDGRTGGVTVALQRANGAYTLTVADDGVGFPADVDFRATDSLGMQLVVTLVNQLEGTITLDRTEGTTFVITFKPAGARIRKSGGE